MKSALLLLALSCQACAAGLANLQPFGNTGKTPEALLSEIAPGTWRVEALSRKTSETLAGLRATNDAGFPPGRYIIEADFRVLETPFGDGLGYGRLMAGPSDRTKPWVLDFPVAAGPQWQTFRVPFRVNEAESGGQFVVQAVSAHPGQISEWRGLRVTRLDGAADTPLPPPSGITYPGREPDAAWRQQARERINAVRMTDFSIRVVDATDAALPAMAIDVQLERHAFPFGTAVSAAKLLDKTPAAERYRQEFLRLFNAAVLENDLKWPALEGEWKGHPRGQTLAALRWLKDKDITVRGHALVWGGRENLPASVHPLLGDPAALQERILAHIREAVSLTRGLVAEWDVVNEPRQHNLVYGVLGPQAAAAWFRSAREADPHAKLFVNEFDLLVTRNAPHPNHRQFLDYLAALQAEGAPIDGIGEQAHIWNIPPSPAHLLRVLDLLATTGLPIVITEFDFAPGDEELQADYTRDFLLAAFSHPAVAGIYFWGFWDGSHWRPGSGLFRRDWTERPSLRAFEQLVREEWSPKLRLTTDAAGAVKFRGFPGDYRVVLPRGATAEITLANERPEASVVVPD